MSDTYAHTHATQFEIVPRDNEESEGDTEKSELIDMVNCGEVAFSVEIVM